jgi:hypothetical protein
LVLAHRIGAAAIGNVEPFEERELMLRIAGPCRLDGVRRREIVDDPGLARALRRLGFDARTDSRETERAERDIALIFDARVRENRNGSFATEGQRVKRAPSTNVTVFPDWRKRQLLRRVL